MKLPIGPMEILKSLNASIAMKLPIGPMEILKSLKIWGGPIHCWSQGLKSWGGPVPPGPHGGCAYEKHGWLPWPRIRCFSSS